MAMTAMAIMTMVMLVIMVMMIGDILDDLIKFAEERSAALGDL